MTRRSRTTLALLATAAALAVPAAASAAGGLLVGISDDALKFQPFPTTVAADKLGASAFRLTLRWSRGQRELSATEREYLDRATVAATGRYRVVLSVFGTTARDAPRTDGERDDYCAYVAGVLSRYHFVRDVVVWNEPNKQFFWMPQYSEEDASLAPAGYVALLARCWDVLHGFRRDVNVITNTSSRGNDNPDASSNVSHSPEKFIQQMGEAYRESKRTRPIFDTVGHHPYGENSRERPWRRHPRATTIGLGDWDKLVQAYYDAFGDTPQPSPGRCVDGKCASIWYMENGYQTTLLPSVQSLYHGAENVANSVPVEGPGDPLGAPVDEKSLAPDHATQLVDALRLAYCQPYVEAYFNFLLRDEADLATWQSGLLWADWSPKPAFAPVAAEIAALKAGRVDCSALKALAAPDSGGAARGPAGSSSTNALFPSIRTGVQVQQTVWPKQRRFNWRNDLWRFRIAAGEDATFTATLVTLGRSSRKLASRSGRSLLHEQGTLRRSYLTWVTFDRRRLKPGHSYRMEITLTSAASKARTFHVAGPTFAVARPKPR